MYCPRCATQNNDDAKFCNGCGASLNFVSQTMADNSPETRPSNTTTPSQFVRAPNTAGGISKIIMGLGLLAVAGGVFFFAPGGRGWWWVWILPSFALLGKGVAEVVTMRHGSGLTPISESDRVSYEAGMLQRRSIPSTQILTFGVLGGLVGGLLGFLLRPSAPFIGQLDFQTVISRGSKLRGVDQLLVSTAQTSFNYLLVGLIIGGIIGAFVSYFLSRR